MIQAQHIPRHLDISQFTEKSDTIICQGSYNHTSIQQPISMFTTRFW